jgi:long-chain acyl-CoA synthetase
LNAETEINQSMVYGDKRPHLVAVIVPDTDWMRDWARENKKPNDLAILADDKEFHTALAPAVGRVNKAVNNIEKVRKFIIANEAFTVENEQMTPTMKVRRHVVREIYGDRLEALYG